MKENDGSRSRTRHSLALMTKIILAAFALLCLWVLHYILFSTHPDIEIDLGYDDVTNSDASVPLLSSSITRPAPSNFCDSFALSVTSAEPALALFPMASTRVGATLTALSGVVPPDGAEYFQICIARHEHYHKVYFEVTPAKGGDVNLYISTNVREPGGTTSTWMARDVGRDTITIPTYVDEFVEAKSHTLYCGVHNPGSGEVAFELKVKIVDVDQETILKRGSLRGGVRVLPGQAPDGKGGVVRDEKREGYAV